MGEPDPPESIDSSIFQPCSCCGRTFRPDALVRHEKICQKTSKKRRVFDSSKQRAAEQTDIPVKHLDKKEKENKPKPKSNWREKHAQLIQTVKTSRVGNISNEDKAACPQQSRIPSDYVQCPTCQRYFNQKAADRHISWCQEHNTQTPKNSANSEAKEKLKARTKYKAPLPKKTKRYGGSKPLNTRSAASLVNRNDKLQRESAPHSSPAALPDTRTNQETALIDTRNIRDVGSKESVRSEGSQKGKARECCTWKGKYNNPACDGRQQHVMKFKERFPYNKRCIDLDETYEADQWRELLQMDRKSERRSPKTVPGIRVAGHHVASHSEHTGHWHKTTEDYSLPEVSSCDEPTRIKNTWNDPDASFSSSDSSNCSLPPISRESADLPMARFCHQCDSKFPIASAKYCCECGAKRRTFGLISSSPSG